MAEIRNHTWKESSKKEMLNPVSGTKIANATGNSEIREFHKNDLPEKNLTRD